MFNSEKQFTSRASKISFEETFMNIDTPDISFDPSVGYRFGYPSHWLSNPSERKMIGLRSLHVTPSPHIFFGEFNIYLDVNPYTNIGSIELNYSVTQSNNLEEIIALLSRDILESQFIKTEDPLTYYQLKLVHKYDPSTRKLSLEVVDRVDPINKYQFAITPDFSDPVEFLKFLNQYPTDPNDDTTYTGYDLLTTYGLNHPTEKTFDNVWDRETLFFHASFSSSRRQLIGRNKDFWTTPSKKYFFRDSTNDFYVTFSTDGVHKIFPYHCNFYLELTFILNYEKSLN